RDTAALVVTRSEPLASVEPRSSTTPFGHLTRTAAPKAGTCRVPSSRARTSGAMICTPTREVSFHSQPAAATRTRMGHGRQAVIVIPSLHVEVLGVNERLALLVDHARGQHVTPGAQRLDDEEERIDDGWL